MALLFCSIALNAGWAFRPSDSLLDYGSFLVAGKALGQGLNPYGIYKNELAPGAKVFTAEVGDWHADSVNLNPPISVYGFRFLADFDGQTGKLAVSFGSLALFAVIAGMLFHAYPQHARPLTVLLVCNLGGLWHVVQLGQIYVVLFGLLTTAWFLLRQGRVSYAAVALGLLIAIKPPFILVPALLFLAGNRRCGLIAAGVAAGLSLLPVLFDGVRIYDQWFAISREVTPNLILGPGNSSLAGFTGRVTSPVVGMSLTLALIGGAMWLCYRFRPDVMACYSLGLLVVLLAGPLTWPGYGMFLLPVLLSRPWRAWEWLAVGILSIPAWLVIHAFETPPGEFLLGSVYFWAFAILLILVTREVLNPSKSWLARNSLRPLSL
jgi:alpha-1,2-mannosyltransferase